MKYFCFVPQDRIIFHRLEHICYTIENGEWPFSRRPPPGFFPPGTPTHNGSGVTPTQGTPTHTDSRSETPVSAILKSDSATGADSDQSEGLPGMDLMGGQVYMMDPVDSDREFLAGLSSSSEVRQTVSHHNNGHRGLCHCFTHSGWWSQAM